jgi:hypothetical protein
LENLKIEKLKIEKGREYVFIYKLIIPLKVTGISIVLKDCE